MPHSWDPSALPKPHTIIDTPRGAIRFYLGDCLDIFARIPAATVSAIATSPPYNLGIRYRSYDDALPRRQYLRWTRRWLMAVARVLAPDGSLFLNVGAK